MGRGHITETAIAAPRLTGGRAQAGKSGGLYFRPQPCAVGTADEFDEFRQADCGFAEREGFPDVSPGEVYAAVTQAFGRAGEITPRPLRPRLGQDGGRDASRQRLAEDLERPAEIEMGLEGVPRAAP